MRTVYVVVEIDSNNSDRRRVRSYHLSEQSAHSYMAYWPGTHYNVNDMTENEAIAMGSRAYVGSPIDS